MPRISRVNLKEITNMHHIILRGVNKQDIFWDNSDREKFIKTIIETKEKFVFELYLYVLMNNHVHVVIYDENKEISNIMHKLCTTYALYFNKKYGRVGHLFQNRYKSICIIDEKHLFNLIRYIHSNPEKEGIGSITEYKWSSYGDYINRNKNKITDTEFILGLFESKQEDALSSFIKFNAKEDKRGYLETKLICENKLSDDEAIIYIKEILGIDNILSITNYNKEIRDSYIYKISKIRGIYKNQIARILGISERSVERIIEKNKSK